MGTILLFVWKKFFLRLFWIAVMATFGVQLILTVLPAKKIVVPNASVGEVSVTYRKWETANYLEWGQKLLQGKLEISDQGTSSWEVKDFILRMNNSLLLCLISFLIASGLGIAIGAYRASLDYEILSGERSGSSYQASRLSQWGLFILSSFPSYVLAYILFIFLSDMDLFLAIVSLALGSGTAMDVARMTENTHSRQLRSKYIESAIANGLKTRGLLPMPGFVAWHAFRNSLITILPVTALRLPLIISSAIMVEMVFEIPGMGQSLLDALIKQDVPKILSIVFVSVVFVQISLFVAEFLAFILHPKADQS